MNARLESSGITYFARVPFRIYFLNKFLFSAVATVFNLGGHQSPGISFQWSHFEKKCFTVNVTAQKHWSDRDINDVGSLIVSVAAHVAFNASYVLLFIET